MKRFAIPILLGAMLASAAQAADLGAPVYKAPPLPAPVGMWDVAFGAALMSDYNFRGISQSNRRPAVSAYFEPRYNVTPDVQLYAGAAGYSINFPNNANAEIDFYGGVRPTFGPLGFDFGLLYFYYPGGQEFGATPTAVAAALPNGNIIKEDLSFLELYAKANYTFNDNWAVGVAGFHDFDWLNFGFDATFVSGYFKYTAPSTLLPYGLGMYVSAELGHYFLGTTDSFYGIPGTAFAGGIPLPDYTTWSVGLGFTYKVFALDLRYYDTNLSKADCNAITGDHTATFSPSNITAINPGGLGSRWCGESFIAKLSVDATLNANIK